MARPVVKQKKPRQNKQTKPSKEVMNTGFFQTTFVHILIIIAVGFLVYSNTFNVPFIFDDMPNIVDNPAVKDFPHSFGTRFIGQLTFTMNYRLHGLDVTGYHIFNLIVHIFNALLIYALLTLTFKSPYFSGYSKDVTTTRYSRNLIALFTALLFVSHPVQTQAVTYIVQRFASLATMFYLLSLVSYSKARLISQEVQSKVKSLFWYGVSLFSAVLAMKTKEISFTLPVVIILYEFMFFNGKIKRRILYLLPLFLIMLIIPLSLIGTDKPLGDIISDVSEATRLQTNISRWDYLFTQFRVIVTYIRLIFLPVNQNLDYDYPTYYSFFDVGVFLSFLFLLSILILSVYLFYRYRKTAPSVTLISFGVLWFFITLSVESSIIPIVDVIYEHRIYLPSAGFFIAFTASIIWLRNRLKNTMPIVGKAIIPILLLVVFIFSVSTYARNNVWQSSTGFWEDVVKKSPLKARPHRTLGFYYKKQGRLEEAIREYQTSLRLDPNDAVAHSNLGGVYEKQGRFKEAMEEFNTAIRLMPDLAAAHTNIGVFYGKQGRLEEAIKELQTALNLDPDDATAHGNLGGIYGKQGRLEEAIKELQTALNLDPDNAAAHYNLGVFYGNQGRLEEAIKELQTALNLDPDNAAAHNSLGVFYGKQGRLEEAIKELQTALNLDPDNAIARINLRVFSQKRDESKRQ
jgi:Flp pilus assembly protein TadD